MNEGTGTGMNGNGKQNDASAETFLLKSQQRATGQLVYSHIKTIVAYVCLSFTHYYTIHPIAMKLWEVVEYTPAKVSGIKKLNIGPRALIIDWEAKGTGMNRNGKQNERRKGNERERE